MRLFHNDWNLKLGEVKIDDAENNTWYTLVVGYAKVVSLNPNIIDESLYIRLYNNQDSLMIGTWLTNLVDGRVNGIIKGHNLSTDIVNQIKKQAARLEALKIFA